MARKKLEKEQNYEEPVEEECGGAKRLFISNKIRLILICALAAVLLITLALGITACSKNSNPVSDPYRYDIGSYKTNTRVQYSATTKGTVNRYKPVSEIKDERGAFTADGFTFDESKRYPTYGSTLSYVIGTTDDKVAARNAIINESGYLCAWGTSGANNGGEQTPDKYTKIDKDGYLYQNKNNEWIHSLVWGTTENKESNYRRLYQHSASKGLYLGDIADDEKAVVKQITMSGRAYLNGYSVTGLYAPAGEVIKIQLSDADMKLTGGVTVHIGQALYNGQANNIWSSKNQMQRFPYLLTTLQINTSTCEYDEESGMWTGYIGSFIGGPIYIRNESATYTTTISGGIPYSHFILGYTTEKEFEENSKTSVPYFDLEVWDSGVLHSGPKKYAQGFSYEELYKAAVLWDKVASVTTTGANYGIVFLYDPFVAAGAAVAFPGRNSVNCPLGWMSSSLNHDSIVKSGSWGNFHEYHHNFQNYGLGSGADGEVTNNGLTLVSYSLFTNISSLRQISGYGGAGLSGWNQYTSATWALNRVNTGAITSTNGLAIYATLLHNFGQSQYISARGASGVNNYLNKWANNTHQDFSYYASMISSYGGGTYTPSDAVKNANYPLFVPVSSVYQTGRTYNYGDEKREINTMQPYVIPYGQSFTVDLRAYTLNDGGQYQSGSVVIGKGFTYNIKGFNAEGVNGTFEATDVAGVYTFTPNKEMRSGKIHVTLGITATDSNWAGKRIDDVDLVLEFQQSHETKKSVLERTTYTYSAGAMYADAVTAYENKFTGYESVNEKWDHKNPTQNCNTDIWFYPDTQANREKYPNAPESYFVHDNTIEVIDGKLYIKEDGKYRVYLRGRVNCALYYSIDGKDYKIGATVKNGSGAAFYLNNPETYFDVEFDEGNVYVTRNGEKTTVTTKYSGERWIYTKEVLIVQSASPVSYIGLGLSQWTVPQYTTKEVDGVIKYYDGNGKEVTADQASNVDPIEPTSASYVNAYRSTYDFASGFESEYFYVRNYSYDYKDNVLQNETTEEKKQELVKEKCVYTAPPTSWGWGNFPIENVVDGNKSTYIHTSGGVSQASPLVLVIDMGEVKSVNRMIIYSQNRPNGDWKVAKSFTLMGSIDGVEYFEVCNLTNVPRNGANVTVNFDEKEFRYYKLSVTESYNTHIIIGEIEMWHVFEVNGGTKISPDNDMFTYKGNWHGAQTNSSYGHVYVGTKGATVSFEFEGTRLGILSSAAYGDDFEVKIDGKKVSSIDLKEVDSGAYLAFLTDVLSEGKHKVTIKCKGTANIDSFAIYP